MKTTPQIGMVLAVAAVWLGALALPAPVAAADTTRPAHNGYRPPSGGPNDNDYHANYHADYSVPQDPRRAPSTVEQRPDPRADGRRFQDGDRYHRAPYGWRR
jgi:hypothetical protein